MPAFLTHWHVLIETAKRSRDAGNDLGSLIIDASALRRRAQGWITPPATPPAGAVWDTGPLPGINFIFPGSDISAMAYLGALAPDISYFQKGNFKKKILDYRRQNRFNPPPSIGNGVPWADLLHFNRSGDVLLAFLEHTAHIPSPALRSQALAFAMGYLSHIATDIALNPCINALAGAYHSNDLPGMFVPLDMHFYVELCLDEYIAYTYFDRSLYNWIHQPWDQYIEPVALACADPSSLSAQVLDLLTDAAEVIYGLTEEQSKNFRQDYQVGLQRLRSYLAGSGVFRFLTFNVLARRRRGDPIIARIAEDLHDPATLNFEQAITYAIHLSEHLCRRAIAYYAALRNTTATASERSRRRSALCEDLRNWNLDTGYAMDITFDEQVTIRLIHNWVHFARLWENENESIAQPQYT
ncbi:MAG TPA: zinc dependent phospholipase C family protein [Ktedonobacteraceae bacterium]|nr:zinc dependent phospholipase C family protein [Ktedonobacteraceae bacterium]